MVRTPDSPDGSFLLELLRYAGWRLRVQDGESTEIYAVRDGIEIVVTADSLPQATAMVFARAMRCGSGNGRGEG